MEDKEQTIANLIYENLGYMYCDNCRFNSEISEEESIRKFGYWGCEDCHRKYNGWGISKTEAEHLAREIIKMLNQISRGDVMYYFYGGSKLAVKKH